MTQLIESIRHQSSGDIELVIIIERSERLFHLLVQQLRGIGIRSLVVFATQKLGISRARNIGIRLSSGDIIAFVDDDAVVCENWKDSMLRAFESNPSVIGVVGPSLPSWENAEDDWLPQEFYWMIGCSAWTGWVGRRKVKYGWGVNMSFRRMVFSKCSFQEGFSDGAGSAGKVGPVGDDTDFCYRATTAFNSVMLYEPSMKVMHWVYHSRMQRRVLRKYSFWQGYAEAKFILDLGAGTTRSRSQAALLSAVLTRMIPNIFADAVNRRSKAAKEIKLLFDFSAFFAIGFLSFASPLLLKLCKPRI